MGFGSNPLRGGTALLGDKAMDRKLKRLGTTGSTKAIAAGIRASMTPVARAMRVAVNATDASSYLKREARKAIGQRFAKNRKKGVREAKVGFAVGKKKKQIKAAGAARDKRVAAGKGGGRGVGISSTNIHWFVLGTDLRRTKSGFGSGPAGTGQIANVFGDVTRRAFAGSNVVAVNAARDKIWKVIKKEALKKG